jgi:hypothetical protein
MGKMPRENFFHSRKNPHCGGEIFTKDSKGRHCVVPFVSDTQNRIFDFNLKCFPLSLSRSICKNEKLPRNDEDLFELLAAA